MTRDAISSSLLMRCQSSFKRFQPAFGSAESVAYAEVQPIDCVQVQIQGLFEFSSKKYGSLRMERHSDGILRLEAISHKRVAKSAIAFDLGTGKFLRIDTIEPNVGDLLLQIAGKTLAEVTNIFELSYDSVEAASTANADWFGWATAMIEGDSRDKVSGSGEA